MNWIRKAADWYAGLLKNKSTGAQLLIVAVTVIFLCCVCAFPVALLSPRSTSDLNQQAASPAVLDEDSTVKTIVAEALATQAASFTQAAPVSTQIPEPPVQLVDYPTEENPVNIIGPMQVTFINVGQGDSILIQSPDGKIGLIDGGEEGSGALQYLQSHGVDHLDLMVATHPHSDHIGGLVSILKSMPVLLLATNGQSYTTPVYEEFINAAIATNPGYMELKRGDKVNLGSLSFDVLHPGSLSSEDLNTNSLVLRLQYGDISFLFMGDANAISDQEILSSGMGVQSTILKVGHHASATSTDPNFLAAVHPLVAIYTAGAGNEFGHPARETIDSLTALGVQVLGTDKNGTIVVTTDGKGVSIQKERESLPTPEPTADVPPAAVPADLFVNVESLSSPISAGSIASITISTIPNSNCSITVVYKSGPSQAAGLGPQTADQSGRVTWSWKVGSRTTPGTWSIQISCSANSNSKSISVPFEVY